MADPLDKLFEALADRYTVEGAIGAGGMATVYLAHDVRHDRKVALKVLRPELAAVMGGERFLTEIRTTANLQHPHILPLFDSGEAEGFLYYVMPFIDGDTLRDRIEREKQLPVEEALAITVKVAGALQAAHDKGIVHRDIKPANILLANGEPLVADFGIALAVQHAGAGRLTETGLSLGTPYYMSPEQATADRDPDARSDVYSLACVLYEMLSGEPPFQGSTAQAVLGRILTQTAPPITDVRASVPAHVGAVLSKALEKLPADRIDSASSFASALIDPAKAAVLAPVAAAAGTSAEAGASGHGSLVSRYLPWAVAVVALVFATLSRMGGPPAQVPTPVRFSLGETPVSADFRRTLTVTPDGSQVVFVGRQGGTSQLFRRPLGSTEVLPIPQTEGASSPAVSPDGRWVAFTTEEGPVRRVPLDGGAPMTIAEPPNQPIGMSWASEERILFGMLAFDDEYPGITAVDMGDPTLQTVSLGPWVEGAPFVMHHEPYALPGGTHALLIDIGEGRGLGRVSLDDGETVRLDLRGPGIRGGQSIVGVTEGILLYVGQSGELHAVRWDDDTLEPVGDVVTVPDVPIGLMEAELARDGTLAMRFAAESYRVVILDDRGEVVDVVAPEWAGYDTPRFSPDGSTLALTGRQVNSRGSELWLYDLASGLLSQLSMGFRAAALDWTPTGDRIVAARLEFSDVARPWTEAWSRAADASDEPVLETTLRAVVLGMSLAPDGSTLAVARDSDPSRGIERMNVDVASLNDTTTTAFAAGDANELAPRFSPDGRWLAYSSNESARPEVYVRPYPGPGARVQVSDQGGWQPLWSRDGETIFYRIGPAVVAAELETDENGRMRVVRRERLFEGDFLGGPLDESATWDVHPSGNRFVLAQGVGGSTGRIIVWRDWLHEVEALLDAAGRR